MSLYTISIRPDSAPDVETTLRVSVDRGVSRITELTVRSTPGKGLLADHWVPSDVEALLRSFFPGRAPRPSADAAETEPAVEPVGKAPTTAAAAPRRTVGAAKAPSKKATRAKSTLRKPRAGKERAYRRMPDDLANTIAKVGTSSRVADHYGVPLHTVKGWVRRLRQMS